MLVNITGTTQGGTGIIDHFFSFNMNKWNFLIIKKKSNDMGQNRINFLYSVLSVRTGRSIFVGLGLDRSE